jgi:hypothetical protein
MENTQCVQSTKTTSGRIEQPTSSIGLSLSLSLSLLLSAGRPIQLEHTCTFWFSIREASMRVKTIGGKGIQMRVLSV